MNASESIHVVLVPGADALPFDEDIDAATARGAHACTVSYAPPTGHPIDDCEAYYQDVSAKIGAVAADIRTRAPDARIFAFGRNLGGSILAYHAARADNFQGLVMIGVIPELSTFRIHGDHPSARRFRQSLEATAEGARIGEIAPLDMTASLAAYPAEQCLIQVGEKDDYMDERAFDIFRNLESQFRTEWLDDVHAMAAPDTVARRWAFIQGLLA
ncbi:MAG: hypothetical protein HOJ06_17010 [Rhodospirillaceae bacterium]|nr:hypothetical protein [Rhodospirillaceae bacterium]